LHTVLGSSSLSLKLRDAFPNVVMFEQTSALPVSRLQLLRIEEELGAAAVYAGAKFRAPVEPY
jgi:hypothetical protein